ncbi:MAG: methyltransferase domain-containing protein [Candidatus Lustribacter sp.]
MTAYRPFVDFYRQNGISPVSQDIADLQRHYERRAALYRLLGIPPGAVTNKRLIEFGPGSGHNAIASASFGPQSYRFVDGNPTGIARLRELFATYAPDVAYDVVESLIEDYAAPERYDLVICEGVIPFQMDPKPFARHVAGFAQPGGIVSLTTIDAVSFLGDLGRRLLADKLVPATVPAPERVRQLVPHFAPHVALLGGMSRPLEDYLYDNIVQPLVGKMFSIPDAIDALDGEFDFYGSSPSFVTELRWFKTLFGDAERRNARAREAYLRNILNLLDTRVELPPHEPELGAAILGHAEAVYAAMQALEAAGSTDTAPVAPLLASIAALAEPFSPLTAEALETLAGALASATATMPGGAFAPFFGRGMQYVSFLRRAGR